MRALIISSDRSEDSELAEPLHQLRAKRVKVDVAAPHKGLIAGKHGHKVCAGLTLDAMRPEDYDLLLLPGGKQGARLGESDERDQGRPRRDGKLR